MAQGAIFRVRRYLQDWRTNLSRQMGPTAPEINDAVGMLDIIIEKVDHEIEFDAEKEYLRPIKASDPLMAMTPHPEHNPDLCPPLEAATCRCWCDDCAKNVHNAPD